MRCDRVKDRSAITAVQHLKFTECERGRVEEEEDGELEEAEDGGSAG